MEFFLAIQLNLYTLEEDCDLKVSIITATFNSDKTLIRNISLVVIILAVTNAFLLFLQTLMPWNNAVGEYSPNANQ